MYKKWQDWQGGALDVWKETPASDIGEGLIRHEWQGEKYGLSQKGTTLKADVMNSLQMGLDFLVDSNHTVVNSEDHYIITIDGLKTSTSNPDGYELTENLRFSIKTTEENTNGVSKLIINGDAYDLKKMVSGSVIELSANDIQKNRAYRVYYDGTQFIIDNSTLLATETEAGITTIEEMWKQDSLVIGGEFGGKFPVTNIKVGKVYYYFDSARNLYVPYTALKTATGTFNAPNAENFKESTFKGFLTQRKILLNTPVEIFILPRNGIEKNVEVTTGHDYKFAEAIVRIYKAGTFDYRITLHASKGGVFRQEDSALTSSGSAITNFEKSKYRLNMYPFADKVYFDGVHYATGDSSNVVITLELLTIYN